MTKRERNGHGEFRPQELTLPDGRNVTLRLMKPADQAALLSFSRALPPDDLLFLRSDITSFETLEDWIRNLETGVTVTVIAELDGEIVGYASLHHDQTRWTRRVGEIRVLLGPAYRGAGLGRRLAEEIFQIGQARGVKKMAAMMTPDQAGARAAFERLGFQVEALLQSWVADRNGRPHDLLVMSHDVEGSIGRLSA
jgi:RimJ/RimL family protein N-acetyltransferase